MIMIVIMTTLLDLFLQGTQNEEGRSKGNEDEKMIFPSVVWLPGPFSNSISSEGIKPLHPSSRYLLSC